MRIPVSVSRATAATLTHSFGLVVVLLWLVAFAPAEVRIVIETEFGSIEATLDDQHAPLTVSNFMRYVDARHFDGGHFHRTVRTQPDNQPRSAVKIDVVQAGVNPQQEARAFPPVKLERTNRTGLRHLDGTLSMARMEADSATSGFFICVGTQPSLDFGGNRNPDLQGFAAFGKVTAGMEIVKRIHQSPAGPSNATEAVAAGNQSLTPPVRIISVRRK